MNVNAISRMAATQVTQSGQSELKTLEKQKELILGKINELNQNKTMSPDEKEKEIRIYQAQLQTIDARIQQIKHKQAEAEKNNAQQSLTGTESSTLGTAPANPLTPGNVDIEA